MLEDREFEGLIRIITYRLGERGCHDAFIKVFRICNMPGVVGAHEEGYVQLVNGGIHRGVRLDAAGWRHCILRRQRAGADRFTENDLIVMACGARKTTTGAVQNNQDHRGRGELRRNDGERDMHTIFWIDEMEI